jgi:hypothetical protein
MTRNFGLALATAVALSAAIPAGSASAQQPTYAVRQPGPWQGYYWHGGGAPSPGWGFGYYGQYSYNPLLEFGGYYGCWRTARVVTPAGVRLVREWICY